MSIKKSTELRLRFHSELIETIALITCEGTSLEGPEFEKEASETSPLVLAERNPRVMATWALY